MTQQPEPPEMRTARRRYVIVCALLWMPSGIGLASMVLLFSERGMSLATIAGLFAAQSLTVAALELPTGGLSDVLGRRPVLAMAGVLNVVACVLVGLGTTASVLAAGLVLMGVARALASGTAEAWYVDTVQERSGPAAELRTGLARGGSATSAALAAGMLLGGALPWLLGLGPDLGARLNEATSGAVLPLSVPMLLGAAVRVAFVCYVLAVLREPPRPPATLRSALRGVPGTVLGGLRLGGRDVLVRRILLTAAAVGCALATIELLVPGRTVELTGAPGSGAMVYSALACAGFVCNGLGSHLAPLAARVAGSGERAVLVCLGTGAVGMLLLGVTAAATTVHSLAMPLAAVGFCLLYLGIGAGSPNQNELLHRRVTGAGRATALSVQSLALQLVGALTGLVVGALRPGPLPWLLTGAALLFSALLWLRRVEARSVPGTITTSGSRSGVS
ncbi:MFS transporter [Streptomyces djakartensis]|uniref:Tetracycline resistance MFS efflux pump n=1 Tax=Streptomyces djakartensis TaxID=68193 RepID=A0ABQ3AAN0_9ACTN|nr:MFS transporter [Streptomyces djakartensis]GGY39305.1 tetracycline resistance MFS efflux pump [Streptomyces djakartensis]